MRGVINLRGNVLPVLDLKLKFGLGATEKTVNTCAIVVEVVLEGELHVLGILADSVQEVFDIDPKQIEPPPRFGTRLSTKYVKGMGRRGEQLFIILDAEKVLSGIEFEEAAQMSSQSAIDEAEQAEGVGGSPAT
jgi:purine-binding chemotaxis protein CheW